MLFGTMYKPESDLENETLKINRDSEIQIDYPIPAGKPDNLMVNYTPPSSAKQTELAVLWILLFQWTTEWKETNTWPEN